MWWQMLEAAAASGSRRRLRPLKLMIVDSHWVLLGSAIVDTQSAVEF